MAEKFLSDEDVFGTKPFDGQTYLSDEDIFGPQAGERTGRLRTASSQFARGVTDVVTGSMKAVPIAQAENRGDMAELFARIDAGQDVSDPFDPMPSRQEIIAEYADANPERKAELRASYANPGDPREAALYRAGEATQVAVESVTPVDPVYSEEFWAGKLPHGLGTTVGFAGVGLAGRGLGLGATLPAGIAGSAMSSAGQFEEALASGASFEDAFAASGYGGMTGAIEGIPIGRLFDRLDKISGGSVKRGLIEAVKQGSEEAIQEFVQTVGDNLIANNLVNYDPDRGTFEGAGEASGTGFTVGALLQLVGGMVVGRRARNMNASDAASTDDTEIKQATRPQNVPDDYEPFYGNDGSQIGWISPDRMTAVALDGGGDVAAPKPAPVGEREAEAAKAPEISADDEASPIDTADIAAGKKIIADGQAMDRANRALLSSGFPGIDSRITVDMPNGMTLPGTVVDSASDNSGTWAKIRLDTGAMVEEPIADLAGRVRPLQDQVPADGAATASVPPVDGEVENVSDILRKGGFPDVGTEVDMSADGGAVMRGTVEGAYYLDDDTPVMRVRTSDGSVRAVAPGQATVTPTDNVVAPQEPENAAVANEAAKDDDPNGLKAMGGGMASAISANLRDRLWDEYQGKASAIDDNVALARKRYPGMNREQFEYWVEDPTRRRPAVPRVNPEVNQRTQEQTPAPAAGVSDSVDTAQGDLFEGSVLSDTDIGMPEAPAGAAETAEKTEETDTTIKGYQDRRADFDIDSETMGATERAKRFFAERDPGFRGYRAAIVDQENNTFAAGEISSSSSGQINKLVEGKSGLTMISEASGDRPSSDVRYLGNAAIDEVISVTRDGADTVMRLGDVGRSRIAKIKSDDSKSSVLDDIAKSAYAATQIELKQLQNSGAVSPQEVANNIDPAIMTVLDRLGVIDLADKARNAFLKRDDINALIEDVAAKVATIERLPFTPPKSKSTDLVPDDAAPSEVQGKSFEVSSDQLKKSLGRYLRNEVSFGMERGEGTTTIYDRKIPVAVVDGSVDADTVIREIGTALRDQLKAEGKSFKTDPAEMDLDEFTIAYRLNNLIPEFQITGAEIGTVVKGNAAGTLGVDVRELYEKFKREVSAQDTVTEPKQIASDDAEKMKSASAKPAQKIEDFGEKLEGARKDYATKLREASDIDPMNVPLSQAWPAPDYQKMIDAGVDPKTVGFIRAARDIIPAKPRDKWKVKGWAAKVEFLRGFANDLVNGDVSIDTLYSRLEDAKTRELQTIRGRVDLYVAVGHEKSLKGITLKSGHYNYFKSIRHDPPIEMWTVEREASGTPFRHWPRIMADARTREDAIDAFKLLYDNMDDTKGSNVSFSIYSYRRGEKSGGFWIGKKAGKNYIDLKKFDDVKAARSYLEDDTNQETLEKLLKEAKEIPNERGSDNSPRVGVDHRSGGDVSPEQFTDAFGFRGVQFGNQVEVGRRQQDLNQTYDALMDLAGVLEVDPKALSLNGELGLAFGARGKGGKRPAAAHYERGTVVINLTKRRGAGSLAHEWWHGLDNYFSRRKGLAGEYFTDQPVSNDDRVRPEVADAFRDLMAQINQTSLKERSKELDKRRTKDYWSTGIEMSARSFESYVIAKLADQGASNDYLANITSEDAFDLEGGYPYPTAAEIPDVRAAFDKLFQTIETRETESGTVEMYRMADQRISSAPLDLGALKNRLGEVGLDDKVSAKVVDQIMGGRAEASYVDGVISIAMTADNPVRALDHEIIHALRDLGVIRDLEWKAVSRAAMKDRARVEDIKTRYKDLKLTDDQIAEEAVAEMFADLGTKNSGAIKRTVKRISNFFEAMGNWLRGSGFRSADDVFAAINRGAVGGRDQTGGSRSEQKFSMRPDSAAFKRWFGDSKVVDSNGDPLVVYHGTPDARGLLDEEGSFRKPVSGEEAYFFTDNRSVARTYADDRRALDFQNAENAVGQMYLSIKNPMVIDANGKSWGQRGGPASQKQQINEAKAKGHDGLIIRNTLDTYNVDSNARSDVYVAFSPKQIKSAEIGPVRVIHSGQTLAGSGPNKGTYDPDDPRLRYSLAPQKKLSPFDEMVLRPSRSVIEAMTTSTGGMIDALKAGASTKAIGESVDRWRTAFQDQYLPLLRVQNAVEESIGRKLRPDENAYIGEELSSGRKGAKLEDVAEKHVRPLIEEMHAKGIRVEELEAFLYARHAPERNKRISEINPKFKPGEGSGMTDAEAADIMKDVRASGRYSDYQALAKRIDAILELGMKERVDAGLLSQEQADQWKKTYAYYVPLRGRSEVDPFSGSDRPRQGGSGISVAGKESQMAFGRKTPARDILAYAIMQTEEAIIRAETNRVAQRVFALAEAAPDDRFWKINKVKYKPVLDKATDTVVYRPVNAITAEDRDFTVVAKFDGKQRRLTFNPDNPTAARVAASLRNLEGEKITAIVKYGGALNRVLSMVNTSLNPEFVITNAFRDLQTAGINLAQYDEKGLIRNTLKDYPKALAGAMKGAFGKDDGSDWVKAYNEFRMAGGRVYFNQIEDVDQQAKKLKRAFGELEGKGGARQKVRAVFNVIENVNLGVESAIRLSAFKNARKAGMSPEQAASLAKNLTVNFNRRGTYGPLMNSAYLFFNASVQGSAVLLQAAKSRRVQKVLGAAVVTGALVEILNVMASDYDDDGELIYDKISDFDKSRNIVIMIPGGDGQHVKIPLPYGYNAFFATGRALVDAYRGKEFGDIFGPLATTVIDSFNPIGGSESILNLISPTITDPVVDLALNRDFADRPIMPEQSQFGPQVPDSQRYWNSVSPVWREITDFLNEASGGDIVRPGAIDISPETLEHIFGVATGAAGSFIDRNVGLIAKLIDPASEVSMNDISFARKVIGQKPTWYDKGAAYERMDRIEQAHADLKEYAERGMGEEADQLVNEQEELLALRNMARSARRALSQIRKEKDSLVRAYDDSKISKAAYTKAYESLKEAEKSVLVDFNAAFIKATKGRE